MTHHWEAKDVGHADDTLLLLLSGDSWLGPVVWQDGEGGQQNAGGHGLQVCGGQAAVVALGEACGRRDIRGAKNE